MKLISVASHGNGAGKTRLLTSILEAWPGRFAALKFTTIFRDGQFCPKDTQRKCACSKLHGDFEVLTDDETIAQPGTDTGRMWEAGARPVAWCLAREGGHAAAWEHARELLPPDAEVLTEGNTALLTVPSDVLLFIVNPAAQRRFWKSNWKELAERAQVIIVNEAPEALGRRKPADDAERRTSLAEVHEAAPDAPRVVARLDAPFHEWAGPYLESLLGRAPVRVP
jgi:hypothetical protein